MCVSMRCASEEETTCWWDSHPVKCPICAGEHAIISGHAAVPCPLCRPGFDGIYNPVRASLWPCRKCGGRGRFLITIRGTDGRDRPAVCLCPKCNGRGAERHLELTTYDKDPFAADWVRRDTLLERFLYWSNQTGTKVATFSWIAVCVPIAVLSAIWPKKTRWLQTCAPPETVIIFENAPGGA